MTSHLFYRKLITKPHTFTRLTGLTPGQFRTLLHALQPHWQQLQSRKKHPGRKHGLGPLGNHLFTLLLYYRSYATYEWLAVWFHVDETTVLRSVKRLEPLLLQITTLPKKPTLSTGEVETLLIDATEQPIERPQKDQRKYYSGKKKQHTLKTEIQVSPNGKTLSVSKSFPGSVHDLTVRRQSAAAPPRAIVIADSGYQGYQHDHPCTVLPLKRTSPALILGVHFFRAIPRDSLTGRKLFARLRPITCRHYATDRLEPYTDFLPADQHLRSKKHTQAIESFHATVRHYLARFHRRTHCYSKSIDLVRATLNLFFFNELAIRPPAKPYSFP